MPTALLMVCFFALLAPCQRLNAQTTAAGEWTWEAGSSTITSVYGRPGVYGTLGTPAPANTPGGRYSSANWTDSSGNLWLFGGYEGDQAQVLNDLWRFQPTTGEWTWIGGSNTTAAVGVYGTLGTPASGNTPGARYSSANWTDNTGNFWLFGGYGYDGGGTFGALNDLWEYSTVTNEWVWMGGSSSANGAGVYGTMGTAASSNIPSARSYATAWTDKKGNFWLFGGGVAAFNQDINDLWEYSPATNEWTWISGSSSNGQAGVYGTQGTPAAGNVPGSRYSAMVWVDNQGNFWLFGGVDPAVQQFGDLWKFNPATVEWEWVGGSQAGNPTYPPAVYGTLGTAAAANTPGSRSDTAFWTDKSGNFWLFGGNDADRLGDVWEFNPTAGEWTWMGGSQSIYPIGVYGTLGTPAVGNIPGSREDAAYWTDKNGNFWLFGGFGEDGGSGQGDLNDLWVYQPAATLALTAVPDPVISPSAGTYTSAQSVTITDSIASANIYYTTDGTTPTYLSTLYSGGILVTSATETIRAIAIATNYLNSAVVSATYTLDLPTAATPVISPAGGNFTTAQSVTITDATANSTIFYTTDGTMPTVKSLSYDFPFTVSSTATVKAIAVVTNYFNSPVASATLNIAQDFSVPATLPSLTIETGENSSNTITVTPEFGFSSPVTFTCSGLPTEATCSFSPSSVTPMNGPASTTITVTAVAPNTASVRGGSLPWLPAGATLAGLLCCCGLRKKRRLKTLLLIVVSVAGVGLVTSCGGGGGGSSSAPPSYTPLPNTETIVVTASSGALKHTTSFTLTVN